MAGLGNFMKEDHYSRQQSLLLFLEKLINFIGLFFSTFLSGMLINNYFYGASLFIGGQLILLVPGVLGKRGRTGIPRRERFKYAVHMPFAIIMLLALLFLFPLNDSSENLPLLLLFLTMQLMIFYLFVGPPLASAYAARRYKQYMPYYILALLLVLLLIWHVQVQVKLFIAAYLAITFFLIAVQRVLTALPRETSNNDAVTLPEVISEIMKVNAYRLYWVMTAATNIAVDISMLLLVCYLPYLHIASIWMQIGNIVLFIILYCMAAFMSRLILKGRIMHDLGKNSVFIIFSVIWIVLSVYLYRNTGYIDEWRLIMAYLLLCICMSALVFIIFSMDSDMQIIVNLRIENLSHTNFKILKALLRQWSTFFSRFVMLLIVGFLAFFTRSNPESYGLIGLLGKYGLFILPTLFLIPGFLAALRQPFNKLYEEKLKKYLILRRSGKSNRSLEDRLRLVLVEKYSKRLGIMLLKSIIKPFFRHRVIGRENVDVESLPAVFACNHSEIYGPVASVLNMPFHFRPWILNEMIDMDKISGHIQQGTFDRQKWIPRPLRDNLGKLFGPVVAWMMRSMEPIPVYRDNGRDTLKGIAMSVEALEADDNILLFPENPLVTGGYLRDGIGEFFSGFVNIARDYYKKTSKSITFYAVYASKKERTLSISKGITFDHNNPFHDEKNRITQYLHDAMVAMSDGNPVNQ